jgi:hypothetical protein
VAHSPPGGHPEAIFGLAPGAPRAYLPVGLRDISGK